MSSPVTRESAADLVASAGRELERRTRFAVAFGGLIEEGGVSVTSHLGGMAVGLAIGRDWLNLRRLQLMRERRRIEAELSRLAKERERKGFQVIRGGKDAEEDEN